MQLRQVLVDPARTKTPFRDQSDTESIDIPGRHALDRHGTEKRGMMNRRTRS